MFDLPLRLDRVQFFVLPTIIPQRIVENEWTLTHDGESVTPLIDVYLVDWDTVRPDLALVYLV